MERRGQGRGRRNKRKIKKEEEEEEKEEKTTVRCTAGFRISRSTCQPLLCSTRACTRTDSERKDYRPASCHNQLGLANRACPPPPLNPPHHPPQINDRSLHSLELPKRQRSLHPVPGGNSDYRVVTRPGPNDREEDAHRRLRMFTSTTQKKTHRRTKEEFSENASILKIGSVIRGNCAAV